MDDFVNNKIIIRKCNIDDLSLIQTFIKINWNPNHVFVRNINLLIWQHLEPDNSLNFYIAVENDTNYVYGIFGFIPLKHFDKTLSSGDYWGAIWKVTDNAPFGIGTKIFETYINDHHIVSHGSIGMNKKVKKLYVFWLKQRPGKLSHYYFLNKNVTNFSIANINNIPRVSNLKSVLFELKVLNSLEEITESKIKYIYKPRKSILYFVNRYFKHPEYKYVFLGVYKSNKLCSFFVVRKIEINKSNCLRIIDFMGDLSIIDNLSVQFQKLLDYYDAEYIDCLNDGIDPKYFVKIGFTKIEKEDNNIIPNYFDPFIKENIDIDYTVKSIHKEYVIFKGDSDQDRPS